MPNNLVSKRKVEIVFALKLKGFSTEEVSSLRSAISESLVLLKKQTSDQYNPLSFYDYTVYLTTSGTVDYPLDEYNLIYGLPQFEEMREFNDNAFINYLAALKGQKDNLLHKRIIFYIVKSTDDYELTSEESYLLEGEKCPLTEIEILLFGEENVSNTIQALLAFSKEDQPIVAISPTQIKSDLFYKLTAHYIVSKTHTEIDERYDHHEASEGKRK